MTAGQHKPAGIGILQADAPASLKTPSSRPTPDQVAARANAKLREAEATASQAIFKLGGLADNSLFAEDAPTEDKTHGARKGSRDGSPLDQQYIKYLAPVLNPKPNARARWQRRMVIRHVKFRGRLTKEMRLARTERTLLSRSHFFKTSMKKLAPLARQIAGKPINEAILQMRFSKKKAAQDVRKHLIQARDEAIVAKGMGLGQVQSTGARSNRAPSASPEPSINPLPSTHTPGLALRSKSPDPTSIYIAQAWINRGPYGRDLDYRARGRVNTLRPPYTGISVLLKEEATRSREQKENEAKDIRKRVKKGLGGMWSQLPDRKIIGPQGQHILW